MAVIVNIYKYNGIPSDLQGALEIGDRLRYYRRSPRHGVFAGTQTIGGLTTPLPSSVYLEIAALAVDQQEIVAKAAADAHINLVWRPLPAPARVGWSGPFSRRY